MPNTPEGVKIGFIPDPGTEEQFFPARTGPERWAHRQKNQQDAYKAAKARRQNSKKSLMQQVEEAQKDIQGRNVRDTVELIQGKSQQDTQVFLLAEEYGDNRASVLRSFGSVSADVKAAYQKELLVARSLADAEDRKSGGYGDNPADAVSASQADSQPESALD